MSCVPVAIFCTLAYMLSQIQGSVQDACTSEDVRLVGGLSVSDGRLEVCTNGTWATVCQQFWNTRNARVVCRQIGYESETAIGVQPWHEQGNGPIYQASLECVGNETSILDCPRCTHCPNDDIISCDHSQDVGMICIPAGGNCTDGELRLADGLSEYEGRLEICYRGVWGTICGDHEIGGDSLTVVPVFDSNAALVACRQLRHQYIGANISYYGPGAGPIFLDNVVCTGEETTLNGCAHSDINDHQCSHNFDIGITCPGYLECLDDDVRLVGPSQTYGRVEVCVNEQWGTVCDNFWDARDARVICRQLGFESETAIGIQTYGGGTGPIHRNLVECTGNESTISQCPSCTEALCVENSQCPGHQYDVAVDCFPQGECTDGSIRLVNGENEYTGGLEYCHLGYWGTVCYLNWDWTFGGWTESFTMEDASVACRQLGFSPEDPIRYIHPFVGSGPIFLGDLHCNGTEDRLTNCSHGPVNEFRSCHHWANTGITCKACTNDDVRLAGGSSNTNGRVELCLNGEWGTICENFWDARDARVICRHLGFESETAIGIHGYGGGTGPIHRNLVECTGNESTISQCPSCTEALCVENSQCPGHQYDVAVDCFPQATEGECTDGSIRLVNGENEYTGGLEYCHLGCWGTVCGYNYDWTHGTWTESFTMEDASVACRQLGYSPEGTSRYVDPVVGSGPIFLGDLHCNGTEDRLINCSHDPVNEFRSCHHWANIGITCRECSDYDVRLAGGSSNTEGRVEVCLNGEWGTVCDNYWDARDARVICRLLGYESDSAIAIPFYGGGEGPIQLDYVSCVGSEAHLSECPPCSVCAASMFVNCDHLRDAGVICFPNGTTECNDTDVRLVGGNNEFEGRVEVCYHGIWGSVCAWHWNWQTLSYNSQPFFPSSGASVICQQLGFLGDGASIVPMDQISVFTSNSRIPIFLDNVMCNGNEEKLSDCTHSPVNEHKCLHEVDLGVQCPVTECDSGAVRLVGGRTESDGRLEICLQGFWGTVCHNYWDARDASVICRQLNYESDTAVGLLEYSGGEGPIHRDYVQCAGEETSLSLCPECSYCVDSFVNCNHFTDAGVICFPEAILEAECNETDLRLVGGSSELEGTVEVCHSGLWGTVCGWHRNWQTNYDVKFIRDIDASVICKQLGFSPNGAAVSNMGQFPLVTGLPIYIDDLRCTGSEETVLECARSKWNVHECWHSGDIGVVCQGEDSTTVDVMFTNTGQSTHPTVNGSQRSPNNPGPIGGGIAGALLILLIVVIFVITVVYLLCRRRRYIKESNRVQSMFDMNEMDTLRAHAQANRSTSNTYLQHGGQTFGGASRGSVIHKEAADLVDGLSEHLLITSDTIRLLDTLGQGEFGIVYKAHLIKPLIAPRPKKGTISKRISTVSSQSDPTEPLVVAVKTLKGFFAEGEITEMIKESVRMQQFDHPNVLSLMGICIDAGPAPYIVMPFMANGSLISYLKMERPNLILTSDADEDAVCTVKKRLIDMCLQIAKGMEYLASMKVIHRDLAARNCMIDIDWSIKVADFGLSESTASKDYFRQDKDTSVKLPIKWMAPESLSDGVFSEKTDVWSFGITFWEVFNGGKSPYTGIHPVDVIGLIENGKRLEKPSNQSCCDNTYSLMRSCWESDPIKRPHFSDLVKSMNQLLGSLSDYLDVSAFQSVPDTTRKVSSYDAIPEDVTPEPVVFENEGAN